MKQESRLIRERKTEMSNGKSSKRKDGVDDGNYQELENLVAETAVCGRVFRRPVSSLLWGL